MYSVHAVNCKFRPCRSIHQINISGLPAQEERRKEDLQMKGARMLVISLGGVNLGFWSHLECSGQNTTVSW